MRDWEELDVSPAGRPPIRVRRRSGSGAGAPGLLLIHGFLGSSRSWIRPAEGLDWPGPVAAVDLPGHGESPGWHSLSPPRPYRIPDVARALGDLQGALFPAPPIWLGYSMGGRIAVAAAAEGVPMAALLLESAAPGMADAPDREARRAVDAARAAELEARGTPAFVDDWLHLPLFAGLRDLPAEIRDEARSLRARQDPRSMAAWLREGGTGSQPWYGDALAGLDLPVRVLVGSRDPKYVSIWTELAPTLRDARVRVVEGVGHVPHLEDGKAWSDWVRAQLPGSAPGS